MVSEQISSEFAFWASFCVPVIFENTCSKLQIKTLYDLVKCWMSSKSAIKVVFPSQYLLLQVNNRNTRKKSLTSFWCFTVDFEQVNVVDDFLFLLLTLNLFHTLF